MEPAEPLGPPPTSSAVPLGATALGHVTMGIIEQPTVADEAAAWYSESLTVTILGKRLSANAARNLTVGLLMGIVVTVVVSHAAFHTWFPTKCSVTNLCSQGAFCNFDDRKNTSGLCEACSECVSCDCAAKRKGVAMGATGLTDAGAADCELRCVCLLIWLLFFPSRFHPKAGVLG